ncbi:hypothetical protein L2E82_32228 [Cichorium intybus]|uniref:Uncharacterized protein n=1 Tax=Cichorium intybus TaxID=13427 RepID=A0ACB9BFE8_CICIN|nr:hypothetical protein L2E82_32228 [Cichorium intybus]
MEQYSQYLMLVKSNNSILMNPFSSQYSWEEQAFAEDARGPFGGFVWPPRSYSCSFCKREFRSAQALGGHMNVHRKERAKLKHTVNGTSSATNCTTTMAPQNHSKQNLCKESLDPGFFPLGLSPSSRVSSISALGEESLDTTSDTKSLVCDEELVTANGYVRTNLVLGFELDSCANAGSGCKRQKTVDTPPIMDGLDLELRLAS